MGNQLVKTYRGIFLDIKDSNICLLHEGMYFYFCSEAMKKHFEKHFPTYLEKTTKRLKAILPETGMEHITKALAIEYYRMIEKRGYRIETFGGAKIKQGHIIGDVEFVEEVEENTLDKK